MPFMITGDGLRPTDGSQIGLAAVGVARLWSAVLVALIGAGCTGPNPDFFGHDSGADANFSDSVGDDISGDATDQRCERSDDCDDGVECTRDRCVERRCTHEVRSGWCLIGTCYEKDDFNPANSCEMCDPSASETQWTPADEGSSCMDDGLTCTRDMCASGACQHPLKSGFCLIDGSCAADGNTKSDDDCQICWSDVSSTAFTFAAGFECGSKGDGVCFQDSCQTIRDIGLGAEADNLRLLAVDAVPASANVWVAAEVTNVLPGGQRGLVASLVGLNTRAIPTSNPLVSISHRAVISDMGDVYYYDTRNGWVLDRAMTNAVFGSGRTAVWGHQTGTNQDTFYFAGDDAVVAPIVACTRSVAGIVSCESAQKGNFSSSTALGWITGAREPESIGGLWSASLNATSSVYYGDAATNTWSLNPPRGCEDERSTPCFTTGAQITDIFASSDADVWAVGELGLILRFDGSSWSRVTGAPDQATIDWSAVWSDGQVAVFSGVQSMAGLRWVLLARYHIQAKRWSSIYTLGSFGLGSISRINDIGGFTPDGLWLVGERNTGIVGIPRGWLFVIN